MGKPCGLAGERWLLASILGAMARLTHGAPFSAAGEPPKDRI